MKVKIYKLKKIILVILAIIFILGNSINAKINSNIFDEILKITKSDIVENGLSTTYITNSNGKNQCISWLKNMNLYNGTPSNKSAWNNVTQDTKSNYFVEFKKNNMSGYIESSKVSQGYRMSIFIKLKTKADELNNLQDKVESACSNHNIFCYKYLKAKSQITNVNSINNKCRNLLVKKKLNNIETVSLNNSFSTTAYTGGTNYIIDNNKKVDLNYAVCKYSNGNYIIIGSPVINITY